MKSIKEALKRALRFYDGLDRPHAPGEAELLDSMQAALAQLDSADERERIDLAAQQFTEWFGYAWSGLDDDRVADKGYKPWCWSGSGQKQFQGGKEDVRDIIRTILSTGLLPDSSPGNEKLGRFGHHPDPAIDFCIEVECIENEWSNIKANFTNGTPTRKEIEDRVFRAMQFRVGGDTGAVDAKAVLRKVEAEMRNDASPGNGAEKVREALEPFASAAKKSTKMRDSRPLMYCDEAMRGLNVGHLRAAENALAALHSTSAAGETTSSDRIMPDDLDKRDMWLREQAANIGYQLIPEAPHPDSPHAASEAEPDDERDLYGEAEQWGMRYAVGLFGKYVARIETWEGGDGSESVDGDVIAEFHNIAKAAGWVNADGDTVFGPSPDVLAMKEALDAAAKYIEQLCKYERDEATEDVLRDAYDAAIDKLSPEVNPLCGAVACHCFDDTRRRYCTDKHRCFRIKAQSASPEVKADASPPDWKQDQAETTRIKPPATAEGGRGEPVAIKPLEWRDHRPDSFPEPAWSAQTPFGYYNIEEVSASDSPAYVVRLHAHHFIADKDSLEDAKAAAQADYEQRIRSALVVHPASPPDVEAVRADERERCAAKAMAPVNGMELQRFIVGGAALTDKHGNDVFIAKPDVERLLTERASAIRTGGQK